MEREGLVAEREHTGGNTPGQDSQLERELTKLTYLNASRKANKREDQQPKPGL